MLQQKNKPQLPFNNKEFLKNEELFTKQHSKDTDEELIGYLKELSIKLGHVPKKHEVYGFTYLKSRFGPWPRVLEKAGLKEIPSKPGRRRR